MTDAHPRASLRGCIAVVVNRGAEGADCAADAESLEYVISGIVVALLLSAVCFFCMMREVVI